MNERIGYPDYLENATELAEEYGNISLAPSAFLGNIFTILTMEATKNFAKP